MCVGMSERKLPYYTRRTKFKKLPCLQTVKMLSSWKLIAYEIFLIYSMCSCQRYPRHVLMQNSASWYVHTGEVSICISWRRWLQKSTMLWTLVVQCRYFRGNTAYWCIFYESLHFGIYPFLISSVFSRSLHLLFLPSMLFSVFIFLCACDSFVYLYLWGIHFWPCVLMSLTLS